MSRSLRLALLVAPFVFLLDQAGKWIILLWVMQPPRVIEVTGFFNLVLTFNRGVSFSLMTGDQVWRPYLLAVLSFAIVVLLFAWLARQDGRAPGLAGGFIAGGAIGNLLDRFVHGGVVDFLDFHLAQLHWPAFNLADSAIVVGVGLILFDGLFARGRADKPRTP